MIPGYRVRVTTTDWNLDGKLDLLIGNCVEGEAPPDKAGKPQRGPTIGHVYVLLRKADS